MQTNSNQTIELINKKGKVIGHTYPKRAKGLIKNGKATWISENQICLTKKNKNLNYNFKEEMPNAILSCINVVMSITALVLCAILSSNVGSAGNILASSLYGGFIFLFYTITTLYYSFKIGKTKNVFYILSLSFTFLLMEGLIIPYTLINRTSLSWSLFGTSTLFNVLGIILTSTCKDKLKVLIMICYIVNLSIFVMLSLHDVFSIIGIFMFIGGIYLYYKNGWKKIVGNSLLLVSNILYFFSIFFCVI